MSFPSLEHSNTDGRKFIEIVHSYCAHTALLSPSSVQQANHMRLQQGLIRATSFGYFTCETLLHIQYLCLAASMSTHPARHTVRTARPQLASVSSCALQ
jgi:hypothetical protein